MNKVSIENKQVKHQDLLGLVFSWSLRDVLNNDLYINKVNQIPDTFPSTAHYLISFRVPLIEETRAEFCSGLESVGQAPACEISTITLSKYYRPPKDLYYEIRTKKISGIENHHGTHYEPESGDIFAVTNVRPRNIGDLIKPDKSLHFAFVSDSSYEDDPIIQILSSEKIDRKLLSEKHGRLYITYLMNLTTNMRIWTALHPDPRSKNLGLIQKVLQYNFLVDDECSVCLSEANVVKGRNMFNYMSLLGLDQSQKAAVLSSIALRECSHKDYNVKLIWGPPGTGKTKTVASMLLILLKLNCCTVLTCAPTNVAVIQVAKRLVTLFLESVKYENYGLGDIVLFGNEERMKIANHVELIDVFLTYRVETIKDCLNRFTGWKSSLESMIALLNDPQARYNSYLAQNKRPMKGVDNDKGAQRNKSSGEIVRGTNVAKSRSNNTTVWKNVIDQSLRESEKENRKKGNRNIQGKHLEEDPKQSADKNTKTESIMTFKEFERKSFCPLANRLVYIAESFCTHLPTSCLRPYVAKQMIRLVDLLRMCLEKARDSGHFSEFMMMKRIEILTILRMLHHRFPDPKIDGSIRNFCLGNARLIFCTASGSIKMSSNVDMVVIDEAAQLKECESAIPLQIPGVKTTILIGDDRQLPAMVQSKVLEKMNFGRSLFQRLAKLGKNKHLLNIQYRMHPSISSFPNKEFYENKIVNAPIVKERSYVKTYLKGDMYGSYSFINVSGGQENFKKGHSPRNFEEAAVVERIIAKLFKDYYCITKKKVSVGVISPYKGQVGFLQEKLEKKYTNHKENFCINIRSVDGFQGGEEDIIIISTVRCNGNGSVGFLSNCQRTNVALTRARYCLWIVGSGSTLGNSKSVWKNLVVDAKTRGCFHNADDGIDLNRANISWKTDFFGHLRLEKARWKVIFSNEFKMSISSIKSVKVQKRVKELLHNIADGRRQNNSEKSTNVPNCKSVALELLEIYKVDEKLNLAWTIDILKEESCYTQAIKVWDVLPASKIPNLANNLSDLFGSYTVDFMNRCKSKCFDGNLVVPMSWPLHTTNGTRLAADPTGHLSHQLACMNIRGNQSESSSSVRNSNVKVWKQVQR